MKKSNKTFFFGETSYESSGVVKIPCKIKNKCFYIKTEILKGDIPWLIGRETMEKMKMIIDVKEEKITLGDLEGIDTKVNIDSKGHLRLYLGIESFNTVWVGEEWSDKVEERNKKLQKLHLQFGHASWEKLWQLLQDANGKYENDKQKGEIVKRDLQKISNNCETCIKYKDTSETCSGIKNGKYFQ